MDYPILDAFIHRLLLNGLDHCDQTLQGGFLRVIYARGIHELNERNLLLGE